MKVYFLRHGIAAERSEWTGEDAARPLTEEGVRKTTEIAASLARLDLKLDAIVTSPLVRARQTAEIAAQALDLEARTVEDPRLAPGFDAAKLRAVLLDHADAGRMMLVGHEPDFSETLRALTGARLAVKKAGLALVDLPEPDARRGRLLWLVPPKVLAR